MGRFVLTIWSICFFLLSFFATTTTKNGMKERAEDGAESEGRREHRVMKERGSVLGVTTFPYRK